MTLVSRRHFLAHTLALTALPAIARALAHRRSPHPTPRAGVTSARMATAAQLAEEDADVREAFESVRKIPQVVDGIRCHCGCAGRPENYSLLSCYEGEHAMARHCMVCQGEGRMAARLHADGKTLDQIRTAIDERYG
jgi:hypothetical protein